MRSRVPLWGQTPQGSLHLGQVHYLDYLQESNPIEGYFSFRLRDDLAAKRLVVSQGGGQVVDVNGELHYLAGLHARTAGAGDRPGMAPVTGTDQRSEEGGRLGRVHAAVGIREADQGSPGSKVHGLSARGSGYLEDVGADPFQVYLVQVSRVPVVVCASRQDSRDGCSGQGGDGEAGAAGGIANGATHLHRLGDEAGGGIGQNCQIGRTVMTGGG